MAAKYLKENPESTLNITTDMLQNTDVNIDSFPVCIQKDIPKIESDNNLKINVFKLQNESAKSTCEAKLEPLYLSKNYDDDDVIDLLYFKDHFMYIRDINLFFRTLAHRVYLCRRCMNYFYRKSTLDNHKKKCGEHDYCKITLPPPNSKWSQIKFEKHSFKNRVPFVIYADFESISEPCSSAESNIPVVSVEPPMVKEQNFKKLFKQNASAVGVYVHSDYTHLYSSQYVS
ncbi:hypothetical protein, partial [Bartonella sp. CL50QHWL]|uniref:hypothetical protein n=1 Tax=Bartonella sp. CL50QHWL TaxID=3243536 RepID=UPI0035D07EA1